MVRLFPQRTDKRRTRWRCGECAEEEEVVVEEVQSKMPES